MEEAVWGLATFLNLILSVFLEKEKALDKQEQTTVQ